MKKPVIIVYDDDKPIYLGEVKNIESGEVILAWKTQCEENLKSLLAIKKAKQEEVDKYIVELQNRCLSLEKRLNIVEAELKFNRGEITESEYKELCNGNK